MKKKIYLLFLSLAMVMLNACDLDLQEDPNAVTRDTASPNFILNRIQVDIAQLFENTGFHGMRLTRIISQNRNTYDQAYIPQTFNNIWLNAYANILNDIKLLIPLAEASNFRRHVGIAKTLRAYTLMLLVDHFGDVPLSEALDEANFNPNVDPGASVYAAARADLVAARADFAAGGLGTPNDFYYGGNVTKWQRLINTLELKYHLNRRLIDPAGSTTAINQLITANNFITAEDNFVFQYGRSLNDPDSRHPRFAATYTAGGGDYQSVFYMWHLTEVKGFDDPRVRYYMYRQRLVNTTNPDELRCINEFAPAHYEGFFPFCNPGERGYWGRDHLNDEGIPPDNLARTVWGLYPAGGRFDNNSAAAVNNPQLGNKGAGIQPIMLSAFVDFMLAEAALTLGTPGDPKELMLSGIRKHMTYVRAFALTTDEAATIREFTPDATYTAQVNNYITIVGNEYDDAAADRKLNVVAREYWLSLYGNGIESYNLYRRTGQPDRMQPGLIANFGDFPRSFLYPNNYVVTNSNAVQKSNFRVRVFWDNNPETGWID
jgi:hypothetical protein